MRNSMSSLSRRVAGRVASIQRKVVPPGRSRSSASASGFLELSSKLSEARARMTKARARRP